MGFLAPSVFRSWVISGEEYERLSLDCSLSLSLSRSFSFSFSFSDVPARGLGLEGVAGGVAGGVTSGG